jgi:hypothetical protein|tara:strand:+ start:1242 stop:2243 length:1002 start_codon:yes stop_codon:yes gene_type:complete
MPNKLLRSPQNISSSGSTSAVQSAQLTITLDNAAAPEYTIIKPSIGTATVVFEYAELCRDYLNLTFNGSYPSSINALKIDLEIKFFDGVNGTGSLVNTYTPPSQYGYDGYGVFVEGSSPTIPASETCISNYTQASGGAKTYTIYTPSGYSGKIPLLNSTGTAMLYESYSTNDGTKQLSNNDIINIIRYGCSRFGNGLQVFFVNKYGAIQQEWFTLKNIESIRSTSEKYNRNIIDASGSYDINTHTRQEFNVKATQEYVLNSDYMPEYYNQVYTEMMLSEQIWVRMQTFYTNSYITTPVNIKTKTLLYKTSVNDRLVQFTFSFDLSADYINNIR